MANHGLSGGSGPHAIRYGWRLRIGMLLPSVNRVAEPEISAMLPEGVSLHTTRLKLVGSTREELLAMTEKVEEGASLLADAVDLVVFHCTAVSTFDPAMEGNLKRRIEQATGKPSMTTSEAITCAFRTLGVRRIVLISPYIKATNEREIAFLAHHGIEVLRDAGMEISEGSRMSSVEPGEWYRYTLAHQHPEADAYFLSCTAIRAAPVIAALERDLGKPVVTSNQAMAWHALRSSGVRDQLREFGRLLDQF
jgi:maleate isomerase